MDQIIGEAFKQGGMALAFVIMLLAYRELQQRRFDDLKQYTERAYNDRKSLIDALTGNTQALTTLSAVLTVMQKEQTEHGTETRKMGDEICDEVRKVRRADKRAAIA